MAKSKTAIPENVGTTDMDKSLAAREHMEDTFWFKAKSGEGKLWGKSYLRVLPAHKNMDGLFFWSVPIHFRVGPGDQKLPCLRRAHNLPCPVCARSWELKNEGKDEDSRKHWSSWQAYMNVIELNEDGRPVDDPPRVRVWSISKKWLDLILDEREETGAGDFTDLVTGRDLEVRRRGQERSTDYRMKLAPQPSAVTYVEALKDLQDLTTVSPYVDAAVLQKALDAPATGGGDPWAPEAALPSGEAKEADEIRQGGQRWGADDAEEEASPAASNADEQAAAKARLEAASQEAAQQAE